MPPPPKPTGGFLGGPPPPSGGFLGGPPPSSGGFLGGPPPSSGGFLGGFGSGAVKEEPVQVEKSPFEENLKEYCEKCFEHFNNVNAPWIGLAWNQYLLESEKGLSEAIKAGENKSCIEISCF